MKLYCLIISVFAISFMGCSSTFELSDFSSKAKFHEDFNKLANNKTLKVILNSDSSFICDNGAQISNDSLTYAVTIQWEKELPSREVKKIDYNNYGNLSGNVMLTNGEEYYAENIKVLSDSTVQFIAYQNIKKQIPLANIKEVSYKNRWPFSGIGIIVGFFTGYAVVILANEFINVHSQGEGDIVGKTTYDIFIAAPILGGIIGYITGYTYTYQFNP